MIKVCVAAIGLSFNKVEIIVSMSKIFDVYEVLAINNSF